VQGVATAVEGSISRKPAAVVLVELLRQKASGILTLTSDSAVRRIFVQLGQVRFAQSDVVAESVGAAQVASGAIKQASFDRALAMAKQNKMALHEALAHSRVMSPEQLQHGVRDGELDVSINGLLERTGSYRFEPQNTVDTVPEARVSPVVLIVGAARRSGAPAESRKWLESQRDAVLSRSLELERELFAVRQAWPGEGVTGFAAGGRTVNEALSRVKETELPLLHWLCLSGLVEFAGGQKTEPSPAPGERGVRAGPDRGKTSMRASAARASCSSKRASASGTRTMIRC
jgi:hypothetical protein